MDKKREMGVATGGVSILAVFVVLCLTTLAVLSLVSAQADLRLSSRTAQASADYYAADLLAQEKLRAIDRALLEEAWEDALAAIGCAAEDYEDGPVAVFAVEIDSVKSIEVRVRVLTDGSGAPSGAEIIEYRTIAAPAEDETDANILRAE